MSAGAGTFLVLNDIYLSLYRRPGADDYHWAIVIVVNGTAGLRYHVVGSSETRWDLTCGEKTDLETADRALVNVRIGRVVDGKAFRTIVTDPRRVKSSERGFTCRSWCLAVIADLAQQGDVVLKRGATVKSLEQEMWRHGDHRRVFGAPGQKALFKLAESCEHPL